jgi:hypothetical protein
MNTGITAAAFPIAAAFPLGKTQIAAKPDQRGGDIFSVEHECVRPELRYSKQ